MRFICIRERFDRTNEQNIEDFQHTYIRLNCIASLKFFTFKYHFKEKIHDTRYIIECYSSKVCI